MVTDKKKLTKFVYQRMLINRLYGFIYYSLYTAVCSVSHSNRVYFYILLRFLLNRPNGPSTAGANLRGQERDRSPPPATQKGRKKLTNFVTVLATFFFS